MTPDTFGPESHEPLAIYDPASSCWRMFGGMFPSDSMPSLATLPAWGMTHAGELFELPMPEPPTVGHASSSLLPTPITTDYNTPGTEWGASKGREQLRDVTALLPTPKTTDEALASPGDARRNSPGLRAVEYLLPTPVSDNSRGLPSASTDYASLANVAAALLPTPRAQNGEPRNQTVWAHPLDQPQNLENALALLPTPAVNDMGAGKTPEQWDEWTAKMRAKHGNGNGHGASLSIEAARIGASTPPPSPDGPQLSDDQHQPPLS